MTTAYCLICSLLVAIGMRGSAEAVSFSQPISTFDEDVGIDYSYLTGGLVTSVHYRDGLPTNLENVNPLTGTRTAINGFSGRADEMKLAVARPTVAGCPQNAPVGTIFTSDGATNFPTPGTKTDARIVMVNPAGGSNPSGAVLGTTTLPGEKADLRGGFYFDYRCIISTARGMPNVNYLVVVSGDEDNLSTSPGGKVWIVPINPGPSFGTPTQLTAITKPHPNNPTLSLPAHLEGVIVVPNDPAKYGPWAGKIVTGDEDRLYSSSNLNDPATIVTSGPNPKLYAIDPQSGTCQSSNNGFVSSTCPTTFPVTAVNEAGQSVALPHPEDFDFIEGDFYGIAFNENSNPAPFGGGQGRIFRASMNDFSPLRGDILITQEYPIDQILNGPLTDAGTNSGLYQIKWDGGKFVATLLTRTNPGSCNPPSSNCLAQWEHVTFVPVSDVQVQKTAANSPLIYGQTASFNITVTANGPGASNNVILTDSLPINTAGINSWTLSGPDAAACQPFNGIGLNCNFGSMQPGTTRSITVSAQTFLPQGACQSTTIPNTANVSADQDSILTNNSSTATITVNCLNVCVPANSAFNLGQAANYTVLGMTGANVIFGSEATTVNGNVGLGANDTGSLIKATINGKLFRDPSVDSGIISSKDLTVTGGIVTQSLAQAVADALAANTALNAKPATQVLGNIGDGTTTINLSNGINVISIASVNTHGVININGPIDAAVVFKVAGGFTCNGCAINLTGGITAQNVLWNFFGAGADVSISKPIGSSKGIFLAPLRNILLDKGTNVGALIGAANGNKLLIHSGATETSPCP
jgi:uncharacterized repeat protein (TIGR01451 family)